MVLGFQAVTVQLGFEQSSELVQSHWKLVQLVKTTL